MARTPSPTPSESSGSNSPSNQRDSMASEQQNHLNARAQMHVINANKAWKALLLFAGNESKLKDLIAPDLEAASSGQCKFAVNETYNGVLLHPESHRLFGELNGWFEPDVRHFGLSNNC